MDGLITGEGFRVVEGLRTPGGGFGRKGIKPLDPGLGLKRWIGFLKFLTTLLVGKSDKPNEIKLRQGDQRGWFIY
jgi:hypothetical protein